MGYFIALLLLLIIASLASAGFFMLRRKPTNPSRAMVRALTIRIALSIVLFLSILIAWQLGLIQPTGIPVVTK